MVTASGLSTHLHRTLSGSNSPGHMPTQAVDNPPKLVGPMALSSEEEQSEEEACTALKPGGSRLPAARDKRGRGSKMGAGVRSKRVKQGGAGRWRRSDAVGKWHMEGFREDPESDILVQGDYAVGTVRVQEQEEGLPAEEGWLGVRLKKEGVDVLGWMQAGELREKVVGRERWVRRLRGKGDEGWDTAGCRWASKSGSLQADREVGKDRGSGKVGGVVGWYLPVQVMEEKFSKAGVRVCMQMRRVAFGKEVVSSLARKAPSFKCTMRPSRARGAGMRYRIHTLCVHGPSIVWALFDFCKCTPGFARLRKELPVFLIICRRTMFYVLIKSRARIKCLSYHIL